MTRWRGGVTESQRLAVVLTRTGRLLVAAPARPVAPLRTATVELVRRDLAVRRGRRKHAS